jgi:hypothetical protein
MEDHNCSGGYVGVSRSDTDHDGASREALRSPTDLPHEASNTRYATPKAENRTLRAMMQYI